MISGVVRDRFPRVVLRVRGSNGHQAIEFIVDTGFDGELALPRSLLQELGAVEAPVLQLVRLADGSIGTASAYDLEVEWDEEFQPVSVVALNGDPLLGVELLTGNLLQSEMRRGGEVLIEPL